LRSRRLTSLSNEQFIQLALDEARLAAEEGSVPIGAVLVAQDGTVVARARNHSDSPTSHAELIALEAFAQDCANLTLFTTLEPCIQCAGAILNAHVGRVVFGAWDEKFGASGSVWDLLRDPRAPWKPEVIGGVMAEECGAVLTEFFRELR
jgi:tRNA(adenine34) deaminase